MGSAKGSAKGSARGSARGSAMGSARGIGSRRMNKVVLLIFIIGSISQASIQRAYDTTAKALLKSSGIESNIDRIANELQEKYIPETYKSLIGFIGYASKIAVDKKVTLKWSFE